MERNIEMDVAREVALKALYEIDVNNAYSNIELNKGITKNRKILNDKDISFISEIVYGTVTWRLTIDEIIKKYSKIRMKKISFWILNILRMGVYQIVFLDKVPKSAAVNECVNLAKRYGHKSSSNFVNAVLRRVSKEDFKEFFNIENDKERISKTTSMPMWIVEELCEQLKYDYEKVNEICVNSNIRPRISIRVNGLKTNRDELAEKLKKKGIGIDKQSSELKQFLYVNKIKNIEEMEEFKNGEFTVQDEEAGNIAVWLGAKENEKVLDACSSPGGKTTFLAELMNNKGEIVAWDMYKHRVKLVDDASKRLGIDIIKTEIKDATIYEEKYEKYFDKILLDVPCLGIGVLKRKPDIKWQKQKEDIKEIVEIQEKILKNCSKYLKVGGTLIYSTCSILKEENNELITRFIDSNKNYKLLKEKQVFQNSKTDGFYMAEIYKNT